MASSEILPTFEKDGRTQVLGITVIENKRSIVLHHHTVMVGETDIEKRANPPDRQSIEIPFEHLKWLSPRLEGIRQRYKIESGFDKK
jgi:hypothetical protein